MNLEASFVIQEYPFFRQIRLHFVQGVVFVSTRLIFDAFISVFLFIYYALNFTTLQDYFTHFELMRTSRCANPG